MTIPTPPTPKSSWPLIGLAILSFVPGLGLLIGAVAVTWALLSDRPRAKLALGVGAAGALLNLIGAVGFTLWIQKNPLVQDAQGRLTQRDLVLVVAAIDRYGARAGRYPTTLQELVGYPIRTTLLNITDQSTGIASMRLYQYHVAPDGASFDVFAVGPDGDPDTVDDIRPDLPDSVASHSGYRPASD